MLKSTDMEMQKTQLLCQTTGEANTATVSFMPISGGLSLLYLLYFVIQGEVSPERGGHEGLFDVIVK